MIYCEVGTQYRGALRRADTSNGEAATEFYGRKALVTPDGRTALSLVLEALRLGPADEVYVTSTFGTHYVSSCVTSTIFNYCRPSKVWTEATRAALVIHEFGVPHPQLLPLKERSREARIPLIENCAHSMSSRLSGRYLGLFGDFAIFTFRKQLLLPCGGLLLGETEGIIYQPSASQQRASAAIEGCLTAELANLTSYEEQRSANFFRLSQLVAQHGYAPYFKLVDGVVPYAFPFLAPSRDVQEALISQLRERGIESFGWRGGHIVVVPVHQILREDYFKLVEETLDEKS